MKKLFVLLFMGLLSFSVLDLAAQSEVKSKGKAKEKAEKKEKPEKKEVAEKKEKPEKKEKTEKKETAEKKEKTEKKEKPEKKEKADKVADKKEKPEKKEKADKVADKNNTIKPAPKTTVKDDGKEADGSTRKKIAGADKQIGKDEKGRTIYEGPRGGQYYINSNGNKTYLKADRKV